MRTPRGQNLVLLALTMLLVVVMATMTLSISARVRNKLELQTKSDVAAYDNAVTTARSLNSLGVINRTIVSHWVVMLGIQANLAFGSSIPAYFDATADALEDFRWRGACGPAGTPKEDQRQKELVAARDAFMHASFSLWSGSGNVDVPFCPQCFPKITPGFGERDAEVAREAKAVHRSIRDLVEVQKDLQKELQDKLENQIGAKHIAGAFPFKVEHGAPVLAGTGVEDRPPGWREVSAALGSTREDINPLAHAAMGTRSNRFLLSGSKWVPSPSGHSYQTIDPYRAQVYRGSITDALNTRFGVPGRQRPFSFHFHAQMMTTYMQKGSASDENADWDSDDSWEFLELVNDIAGGEPTETAVPEPPARQPEEWSPRYANRITPAREIGFEYVTAKQPGSLKIRYDGPCGLHREDLNIYSWARMHSDGVDYAATSHSWDRGVSSPRIRAPDMTSTVNVRAPEVLHGRKSGGQGLDTPGHVPSGLCHWWHKHGGELDDTDHWAGPEIDGLGVAPGGFGFVFPQAGSDPSTGMPRDGASGAFGQPKLPVLISRAQSGGGLVKDPWDLTFRFRFAQTGSGSQIDLAKETSGSPMSALSTGIAYYHRRCDTHQTGSLALYAVPGLPEPDRGKPGACRSWNEPPNLLNPFWHATLVPIDVDEHLPSDGDQTPGNRRRSEAHRMLKASAFDDAAETYRLLKNDGYEGIE